MVNELLKIAKKPEGPLQILQGDLELGLQLVAHTIHIYKQHYIRIPQGMVPMGELGYEKRLCNMALVSAAASWDGFKGNIVREVRESDHSFSESKLRQRLEQISSYECIKEPLARRHCIVHNSARVDQEYKRDIPSSQLNIGDSLAISLEYLKEASVSFFKTAVDLVKVLVEEGLIPKEYQKTIGEFQRDPSLGETTLFFKKQ